MDKNKKGLYKLIKLLFDNPWKFKVELESDDSIPMTLLINRISKSIQYDDWYIRDFICEHDDFEVFIENEREYVKING